ncbi:MAG: AmmeMemoRadiSam system protein B [candidate division Zixibacteria bacterium]|nr:AmmeMemoRadiSam system protein B [candidate division Zixibacteria bacterium]
MTGDNVDVRRPAVAGTFYPANPVELTKTIAQMFAEVEKVSLSGRPIGLVAPHAGYLYSGKIAARAFKLLEGEEFDSVVLVSPSHTVFFKGSAVFPGEGYQTPIGVVESDKELATRIASIHPAVYFSSMGHASGSTRGEHALEVQLPFLQIVLGATFKMVAIVMGDQEPDSIRALGEVLAGTLKDSNTLLIASTDLSHFHTEKAARKLDFAIQSAIEKYDPELLIDTLESGKGEACGGGPVAAVMMAARRMGAAEMKFLEYGTSAAVTGDFDEVVGYLSAAIVQQGTHRVGPRPKAELGATAAKRDKNDPPNEDEQRSLLTIARESIGSKLFKHRYDMPLYPSLEDRKQGLFVTLKVDGEQRGCVGRIQAREPLTDSVASMAQAAAFDDPRFTEIAPEEFERMTIEISLLSRLERVKDFERDIVIGRDGLLVKLDMHSGLLLPQVATDHGYTAEQFLEQTCLKAGLPKNAYKDRYAEVYKFTAFVFGEKK